MPGAAIVIKGTNKGIATDGNGAFEIKAHQGDILVFSTIGYAPKEVKVGKERNLNIVLSVDVLQLEGTEVVAVAYGTTDKKSFTGSMATIKAETIQAKQSSDVAKTLEGAVAGVQISTSSGQPGSNSAIRIRGIGSINASSAPLIILDGVPFEGTLNAINNSDIESVNVLKDASSSALYGARGANGVVLITTKKGAEGKPSFSYNTYLSIQNVSKKIDLLNAYEYADLVKDARNNSYADRMESINKRRAARSQAPISFSSADDNATRLKNTNNDYNTIIPVELQPYLQGVQGLTDTDWQDEIFSNFIWFLAKKCRDMRALQFHFF